MTNIFIKRLNKYTSSFLTAISCLLFSIALSGNLNAKTLDRIVAVVEQDVIMASELMLRVQVLVQQYAQNRDALPSEDILMEQVLQHLIIERLQLQLAERRGIQVDELSLDQAMRNLAKRNKLTLEQFRNVLVEQGINYVTFRDKIRNEMVLERLRQRIIERDIQVTDSEIEELVIKSDEDLLRKEHEYHLAHILIAVPEAPKPEQIERAKQRASLVYERAASGGNFAKLAIAASDGQNALQGGDLGWRNKAQLPPLFLQQIVQMMPGDVSKIAQSPAGYHIFKVIGRREIKDTMVNQILCRHILVRTNALLDDAAAEVKLKDLRSRIMQGEDFGELAREHSEDPGSAVNGGQLGWAVSNSYVPKFKAVVDNLDTNQISKPFPSRYGWHIVQLLGTRKHDNTQDAMHAEARIQIRQRKIEEKTELWLRELRDESYIENRLQTSY